MKQQTAVDFLHSKILLNIGLDDNDILDLRELVENSKEMERIQHMKTWTKAIDQTQERAWNIIRAYDDFDDHYNETYCR